MRNSRHSARRRSVRGGALLITVLAVVVLTALSTSILVVTASAQRENLTSSDQMKALYLAEAGVSDLVARLRTELENPTGPGGTPIMPAVGSVAAPQVFSAGTYFGAVVDNLDGTFTLTSVGSCGRVSQSIEVVADSAAFGLFGNAVFAGNSDGDPNYSLGFSGLGTQHDEIVGDIYSGGDIDIVDDATVSGNKRASGTISGGAGQQGVTLPLPDIVGMDYTNVHDVNVAAEFASSETWVASALGGSAFELPEASFAHIFRKNPSDRSADTATTNKDDFFLEDPYEPLQIDKAQDGSDASQITLSGGANPGSDGNNLLYYIDGNLWLHNKDAYSFQFAQPGSTGGVKATFVVRGNIYYSDNLFLKDKSNDAFAFIAIKDPAEPDSGNVYFGDPTYGTLREMHAYMYAENNFYDYNLDASGSAEVELFGIMSAGNQVQIKRDFQGQHSKLMVDFDDRVWTGKVELPGLPGSSGAGGGVAVLSWRRVATP